MHLGDLDLLTVFRFANTLFAINKGVEDSYILGVLDQISNPDGQGSITDRIDDTTWISLEDRGVDPRRPYRCYLPSGKHIDLFFYDGNVAQDVAFRGLLNNGKGFAKRLLDIFDFADFYAC